MTLTMELLKAKHIGVRELGRNVSTYLKKDVPCVVDVKGKKDKVIISLDVLVDLLEMLEDLQDRDLLDLVRQSRAAVASGEKEVPVENVIKKRK